MADLYQLTPQQIADLLDRIPLAARSIEVAARRYRQFERSVNHLGTSYPRTPTVLRLAGVEIEPNDAIPIGLAICVGPGREIVGVLPLPEIDDGR